MKAAALITGAAGVGKTTFAEMLKLALYNHEKMIVEPYLIPMAEQIKQIAITEFGWNGEKDEKGRRILQVLGTDVGRMYNENIWVEKAIDVFLWKASTFRPNYRPYALMISDDVRFDNEIDNVINHRDIDLHFVFKVGGPSRVDLPGDTANHISENGLTEKRVYVIIDNSSSKEDLEKQARDWADIIVHSFEQAEGWYLEHADI